MRLIESLRAGLRTCTTRRGTPVFCGWDLGDSDMTAIWFIQPVMGQYRVIDYAEDSHKPMSHYLTLARKQGYSYGKRLLPLGRKLLQILIGSLEETMRPSEAGMLAVTPTRI